MPAPWREHYIAHVRTIANETFDWSVIGPRIQFLQSRIAADVAADQKKLYSTAAFTDNLTQDLVLGSGIFRTTVPGLMPLVRDRRAYLLGLPELAKPAPSVVLDRRPDPPHQVEDPAGLRPATGPVAAGVVRRGSDRWSTAQSSRDVPSASNSATSSPLVRLDGSSTDRQ